MLAPDHVFFPRAEMIADYQGIDGVAFIMSGDVVIISFVRLVERDARSNEL